MMVVCSVMLYFALCSLIDERAPLKWPNTGGRITHSAILSEFHAGGPRMASHTTYHPDVRYEFTIGNRMYSGCMISRVDDDSTAQSVQQVLYRYPVGSQVKVFYAPSNPSSNVLEPHISMQTVIITSGLALMLCIIVFSKMSLSRKAIHLNRH